MKINRSDNKKTSLVLVLNSNEDILVGLIILWIYSANKKVGDRTARSVLSNQLIWVYHKKAKNVKFFKIITT